MAQIKIIKRQEKTAQEKQASHKTVTTRVTVQEWVNEYQTTKSNNARTDFTALFVPAQIG